MTPEEIRQLKALIQKFLKTLDDEDADDWYDTERGVGKEIFKMFFAWLRTQKGDRK